MARQPVSSASITNGIKVYNWLCSTVLARAMASPCCASTRCSSSTADAAILITIAGDVMLSLVAVIDVEPIPIAVTNPLDDTVATVGCDDRQLTARPFNTLPCESLGCALY